MRVFWWLRFGRVPEIDAQELHARMKTGSAPQIVDVRTVALFDESRIAGAINAPVTELTAHPSPLALYRKRPVVAVCRSARRSLPAVSMLRARGDDACQLRQGMRAWWGVGHPVEGEHPSAG